MELDEEWRLECHCQHPLLHHRALNVIVLVVIVTIISVVVLVTKIILTFEVGNSWLGLDVFCPFDDFDCSTW